MPETENIQNREMVWGAGVEKQALQQVSSLISSKLKLKTSISPDELTFRAEKIGAKKGVLSVKGEIKKELIYLKFKLLRFDIDKEG